MTIVSHTLVNRGMPFIEPVLRQAEPFMDRMLITISEKSDDGTLQVLRKLEKEFPKKIRIDFENVESKGLLTGERQKQVQKSSEDWILFLDDDDWWPTDSLKETMRLIDKKEDVDAYAVSPYQVLDEKYYDKHWYETKFFTKLFKNEGINYRYLWPKDLIFKRKAILYWRRNPRVKTLRGKYYHLSAIKAGSFRKEDWAQVINKDKVRKSTLYSDEMKDEIWKIFNWKATH